MDNVDIDKIIISVRFLVPKAIHTLLVTKMRQNLSLLKMSDYARNFDEAKRMYFLIEGDKMLEKYNKIWDIVSD